MMQTVLFSAAALLPAFAAGQRLFNLSHTIALYPLLFLFLFRTHEKRSERLGLLFLAAGCGLVLSGILFDRLSLLWIGSYWNFLGICSLGGIHFAFPAPLLVFACPPLSAFSSILAGFEMRLWLSRSAAEILTLLDRSSYASGNLIYFHGRPYAVDRVCEGMKMAVAAFLVSTVLARNASVRGKLVILIFAPLLWLLSNLLRILSLVLFRVPPEQTGHEIIGLVFFTCMIVFPVWFLTILMPANAPSARSAPPVLRRIPVAAGAVLSVLGLFSIFHTPREEQILWPSEIAGYELKKDEVRENGRIAVYRHEENSLILKANPFAPGSAHDPRICFEAAGFVFRETGREAVDGFAVRSARVEKDGKPARLLWWYAWDDVRSDSDVDWRLARLRGRRVTQYNLYGTDGPFLRAEAARFLKYRSD